MPQKLDTFRAFLWIDKRYTIRSLYLFLVAIILKVEYSSISYTLFTTQVLIPR